MEEPAPLTPRLARLLVLLAAVLFSTGGAGIKVAAFSAMQVSALRSGVAALVLVLLLRGRIVWSVPGLWAGLVYALTLTLFVASTKLTTAGSAIFLQSTAPLYLLMLGPKLLGEQFTRTDLWYAVVAGVGIAGCLFGQPGSTATAPDPAAGNLLGVLSSMTWALTLAGLRHIEREGGRAHVGLSAVVLGNALASLGALPFAWPFPTASAEEWATVVYLGVGQIGLAYVCLTAAIRHLPVLEVSLLLLIEPVLNPTWTWLVRAERPGSWTLIGGALIVAATLWRTLHDGRAASPTARPIGP